MDSAQSDKNALGRIIKLVGLVPVALLVGIAHIGWAGTINDLDLRAKERPTRDKAAQTLIDRLTQELDVGTGHGLIPKGGGRGGSRGSPSPGRRGGSSFGVGIRISLPIFGGSRHVSNDDASDDDSLVEWGVVPDVDEYTDPATDTDRVTSTSRSSDASDKTPPKDTSSVAEPTDFSVSPNNLEEVRSALEGVRNDLRQVLSEAEKKLINTDISDHLGQAIRLDNYLSIRDQLHAAQDALNQLQPQTGNSGGGNQQHPPTPQFQTMQEAVEWGQQQGLRQWLEEAVGGS